MKRVIWILMATLAIAGLVAVTVSTLQAQQRKGARYGAGQSPEAAALLAQEWARAHARPGR